MWCMESTRHTSLFVLWVLVPWTTLHLGLHVLDGMVGAQLHAVLSYTLGFFGVVACTLSASRAGCLVTDGFRKVLPVALILFCGCTLLTALDGMIGAKAWLFGGLVMLLTSVIGVAIGHEVQDRAHLWPLIIVAVCFDLWSVTAPDGVSHQFVVSRGIDTISFVLTVFVPLPGMGVQQILGIGDLIFSGLLVGAAHGLGLPATRGFVGQILGYASCLLLLYFTELPIPALVFVGPIWGLSYVGWIRPRCLELCYAFGFIGIAYSLHLLVSYL